MPLTRVPRVMDLASYGRLHGVPEGNNNHMPAPTVQTIHFGQAVDAAIQDVDAAVQDVEAVQPAQPAQLAQAVEVVQPAQAAQAVQPAVAPNAEDIANNNVPGVSPYEVGLVIPKEAVARSTRAREEKEQAAENAQATVAETMDTHTAAVNTTYTSAGAPQTVGAFMAVSKKPVSTKTGTEAAATGHHTCSIL